jgi:hypothetical protein
VKRRIASDIVEQWIAHMRLQRARACDMVWLIEHGATLHEGREDLQMTDATQRWLSEQRKVIAEVDRLLALYEDANAVEHPAFVSANAKRDISGTT